MTNHAQRAGRSKSLTPVAQRGGFPLIKDLVYNTLVSIGGQWVAQTAERTTDYLQKWKARPHTILFDRTPTEAARRQRRLCLFSHFDQHGRVDDYVLYYLHELGQAGFDIHVISTAATFAPDQVERLKPFCLSVILKENVGLDFCSWQLGLRLHPEFKEYDELLLANDSAYGPLFDLNTVLRTMSEKRCDAWGITDSWLMQYHLQSYFIVLKQKVFTSAYFDRFFESVVPLSNKMKIIERYEMGLTRTILQHGHKIEAFCNFRELYENHFDARTRRCSSNGEAQQKNPAVFFWKPLLREKLSPFVKVSVLRDNLNHQLAPNDLEGMFADADLPYPLALILNHQKRVSRGFIP